MNNVFEGNFGNKEKPKKYFKLKLISPEGLYVPCFVCEANDKDEAKVQAEAALEADLKKGYKLEDPEEISQKTFEAIQTSERGEDFQQIAAGE